MAEGFQAIVDQGVVQVWKQCRRCGLLTRDRFAGGGKCPVFPGHPGQRAYHDLAYVRVELRVLDDVIKPEFRKEQT